MPLTQDELQTVINLVDARLERQYNEEYQTILDKLTEFQWRTYEQKLSYQRNQGFE